MDINVLFTTDIFNWVIMPILIFISRVLDVSFGTIRVIFISQGYKKIASIVAFFEIFIWLLVARQVITNLENFTWILAYCFGYATGTYVGINICEKLSIGKVTIRAILRRHFKEIITELRKKGFGVTVVDAKGAKKTFKLIYSTIDLKDLKEVVGIIKGYNPKAFYTIESVKEVKDGTFRKHIKQFKLKDFTMLNMHSLRKAK